MNIKECIHKRHWQCEVEALKRWQSVSIVFLTPDGIEDETQFDIRHAGTNAGIKELEELFADFCKVNGFQRSSVQYVVIVKSADSFEEL